VTIEQFWLCAGLTGQFLFSCRFVVQWLSSEMSGKSIVPIAFWYFSIAGSLILLSYAIHQADPVFIIGQSTGFIIYLRNLMLIHNERRQQYTGIEVSGAE
jgi:lipid-A-disaccharide synthase-like uncharacterized protein